MVTNKKAQKPKGWLRKKANHDTRQEILDAAAIEFSENGYEGASLRGIAQRVGIKPPSLYNHFKSKNAILSEFLENAGTQLLEYCQTGVDSAAPNPSAQLEAYVESYVRFEIEKMELMPLMNRMVVRASSLTKALNKRQRDKMINLQRRLVEILRNILAQGKETGDMDFENLTVTTFAILGIIEHVAFWYQRDGKLSASDITDHLARLALCTVKAV